ANHRILLLGTCRESDLSQTHPLRVLLNTLPREQVLGTLSVPPLTADEVGGLVAHLPVPFIRHIKRYASGNPFFAEELARLAGTDDSMGRESASSPSKRPGTVIPRLSPRSSICA